MHAGESCGNGQTLADLRQRASERNLKYSCYDVFGDPKNQSQWKDISTCASRIITAEQQGTTPELNECFLAEKEGVILFFPLSDAILRGILSAIVFFRYSTSWFNCRRCVGRSLCSCSSCYHCTVHFTICTEAQVSCKTFVE